MTTRRVLAAAAGAFVVTMLAGAPALGQAEGFDQDLAEQLQQELEAMLSQAGAAPGDFPDLIGEPGEFDLPPGELTAVLPLIVERADAADLPGDGGSGNTGPCLGVVMSFDDQGELIDVLADTDPAGPPVDLFNEEGAVQGMTAANPLLVHVNGFVAYAGVAGPPGGGPRNHSWEITTQGGLTVDQGGDPNDEGENRNAGTVDLAEQLPGPAKINALFAIEGEMTADDGFACAGSGFFKTVGGAPVAGGVGVALAVVAGLGGIFNARPARTWSG